MYLHSNFSRGLLDLATPLFAEIEQNHTPDFAEEDGKYIFEVEMPGFSKEDVKVNINTEGHLNLQGKTKRKGKEVKFGHTYQIPEKADPSTADAVLKNGIFKLTLNKKHKHKPKEIEIK
jgi:HSP20 family molecular chaperone IbpA|tara:strand:+ start:88 stop:444 length:357 start_codon:yes stop_codon:yes gene_type:complete